MSCNLQDIFVIIPVLCVSFHKSELGDMQKHSQPSGLKFIMELTPLFVKDLVAAVSVIEEFFMLVCLSVLVEVKHYQVFLILITSK